MRKFKPMAETWRWLDNQMLPNIVYPPTYDVYHRLCWEYLDREARQRAKDALLGRSHNPGNKATSQNAGQGNPQPLSGPPPGAGAPNSAKAQQLAADKKLAKEKGWCITFFTTGSCSRLNCPYPSYQKVRSTTHGRTHGCPAK